MSNDQKKKQIPQRRRGQQNKPGQKPLLPRYKRGPFSYLIIAIVIFTVMMILPQLQRVEEIRLDEFIEHVKNDHIDSVTMKDVEIIGKFNEAGIKSRGDKAKVSFVVYYIQAAQGERIESLLDEKNIKRDIAPPKTWLFNLLGMFLPIIILVAIFYFLFARNLRSGAGGMLMSFGRSKHRLQGKDRATVTFEDVAGVDEAKDEVAETIEFLKNPKKFQRLGGRIQIGRAHV